MRWNMAFPSGCHLANKRLWFGAGLALLVALAWVLSFVLVPRNADPVAAFQTIQPGMTYQEVRTVLVQPHVAGPLARSFGTPNPLSEAVWRGEPSFEEQEWGWVNNPTNYEAE